LHILANSDSKEDQALKIKVRDKILVESESLFKQAASKQEAEENARKNLERIKEIAQNEVYSQGYKYKVNAEVVNMYFTTRTYDNVTLPAGNYDAVRITLGEAKGHNWWCVLFPSLCIPAAQEKDKQKIGDVLTENEVNIVENPENVVIKFKAVELFEEFKQWLKTSI
jgi:stage II sporulation protein R